MISATITGTPFPRPPRLPAGCAAFVVGGDELAVHRKMQFRTLPGDQAGGARAVLDGGMALRLPRPHRDDVRIAVGGLAGGLLLSALGLYSRTSDDPITVVDAHWAVLVPLVVTAACELLRRTRPRAALLVGTVAITADLMT